jgi:hypothetical protein
VSFMSDAPGWDEATLRRAVRLDRYAEILAHVLHFGTGNTPEVVARFGLSLERWSAIDRSWADALAIGVRQIPRETVLRFSTTFHAVRQRLAQQKPALATLGNAAKEASVTEPEPAPPKPRVEVPSFMLAAAAAPSVPPAPRAPPHPSPARSLDTTWGFVPVPAGTTSPMPFVEGTPAESALHSAVEHTDAVQGPKPAERRPLEATIPLGKVLVRPTLPFGGAPAGFSPEAAARRVPELTLEQRASLHVELKMQPERKLQILHRYGSTPEQHERASAAWEARLAQNPKLRSEWEHAVVQYRLWLVRNARR